MRRAASISPEGSDPAAMYQVLVFDPSHTFVPPSAGSLRIRVARDDAGLVSALCAREWDAILTFGEKRWGPLAHQPYFIRRRWVHLDAAPDADTLVRTTQNVYWGYTRPGSDALPLVSITTPMHDASAFIFETANAVLAQTWTNFEWLVIDDGSGDASVDILESLRDPRIRVERVKPSGRIGWLKQAATSLARGEFLVELDHDDFLVPTALEKIVAAFRADPSVGMVYSNFAEWFAGTREFHVYQVPFWKYRDTPWNGMVAKEALAPDAMGTFVADGVERPVMDAMNVCPNHVRAFRADALRRAGGYRNLVWADDYDVMIRMFLTSNLKKIDELLYVQRMGTNTWTRNTKLLWPCFGEIRRHHLPALHARYRELGLPVLP